MASPFLRCDAPLIRFMSKMFDPMYARKWQDLPLIVASESLVRDPVDIKHFYDVRWRPFDDFVVAYDDLLNPYTGSTRRNNMYCRVTTSSRFFETISSTSPWWEKESGITSLHKDSVVCATWVQHYLSDDAEAWSTDLVEIMGDPPHHYGIVSHSQNKPFTKEDAKRLRTDSLIRTMLTARIVTYLGTCNEYLVKQCPSGPAPLRKIKDIKPWTYTHLPRIILLDPTATPSGPANDLEGTHACPRPHQRRGHWRRLLSPRYQHRGQRIFVKPAWIGPREWILNGSVYRVLDEANRPQPKGPTNIERAAMTVLDGLNIAYTPQKVIGRCIVDIFIEPNIVLELDGTYWHNLPGAKERDARRDSWLQSRGYVVYRLSEDELIVDARAAVCTALDQLL